MVAKNREGGKVKGKKSTKKTNKKTGKKRAAKWKASKNEVRNTHGWSEVTPMTFPVWAFGGKGGKNGGGRPGNGHPD